MIRAAATASPFHSDKVAEPTPRPARGFRAHLRAASRPASAAPPPAGALPQPGQLGQPGAAPLDAASAAPPDPAPVAALIAATLGRALAALGGGARIATPTPSSVTGMLPDANLPADGTVPVAEGTPTSGTGTQGAAIDLPRTPLEQAIHDLLRLQEPGEAASDHPATLPVQLAGHAADRLVTDAMSSRGRTLPGLSIAGPRPALELPEPAANPSHVHLVIDDGDSRVVVTVAVRGADVRVAMRSSDDATAASFARNAASLDDAMRARGLHLGEFVAHRDHDRRQSPQPEREPPSDTPDEPAPFTLEDYT